MKHLLSLLGFLVSASAIAGCTQAQPSNPLADVDGFCQEKATAECQVTTSCTLDPMTCTNARTALCLSEAASATASGTRTYDANNAQACIDVVTRAYANMAPRVLYATLEGPGSITDLCNRVFTGNLPTDTACSSDYDCAGSAVCAPVVPGSATSVCAEPVAMPIALNGFCDNPGSTCATDLYCAVQTSGAAQCVPAAGLDASCANGVACVSADQCSAAQTCIPRQTLGGGCSSDEQCDPATAPYCDPADHLCSIGLTFAAGSVDCLAFTHPGDGGAPSTVATPTADAGPLTTDASTDAGAATDASSD